MPYNKEQFYATITPRPRKIAFLINPNKCPNLLLDSIYEFNIGHWGGRYNPIIPVINSKIDDSYWDLLKFCDPDVVYTYTRLTKSIIDKIDREISPFHFIMHKGHNYGPYRYRVDLHGQIAAKMLYATFNKIFKQDPFFNPSLFIYNGSKNTKDYHLILRNFGIINDTVLSDKVPQEIATLKIGNGSNLRQIIKKIAETKSLVAPIQLSENSQCYYEPEYNRQNDSFFIYIGDNIWNWIHCWNRNLILSQWRRSQILQLCFPKELFNSEEFRNNLVEFLSNKFWSSDNYPATIYFVSNEINEAELKGISSSMPRKGNFFFAELNIDTKRFLNFNIKFKGGNLLKHGREIQLSGDSVLLQNVKPDFLEQRGGDLKWMLDLAITYRPEKFTYTNVNYWWKLPKRSGITSLFINSCPGRITNEGMISVETISNKRNLELSIPKDSTVIQSYIFNYCTCCYTDDLRYKNSETKCKKDIKKIISISDKGAYTRGVIDMFPSLFEANQFIENRYWRNMITKLCNTDSKDDEKYLKPIINRIHKTLTRFHEDLHSDPEGAKKWLANFIYNKAKEIRISKAYISFSEMMDVLKEERKEFIKQHQNSRGFDISAKANENDLKDSLSGYISMGIFEQGVRIACSFCGTTFWYAIEELKKEVNCKGCRTINQIPIEVRWIYKLNELFKNAIEFHGVLPSIWALGHIFSSTQDSSFVYSTGLELYKRYKSKKSYGELDLICILNGKFVIGEIKSSSNDLGKGDLRHFARLCKEIMPQKVMICVLKDSDNRLKSLVEFLDKELKIFNIEVVG